MKMCERIFRKNPSLIQSNGPIIFLGVLSNFDSYTYIDENSAAHTQHSNRASDEFRFFNTEKFLIKRLKYKMYNYVSLWANSNESHALASNYCTVHTHSLIHISMDAF